MAREAIGLAPRFCSLIHGRKVEVKIEGEIERASERHVKRTDCFDLFIFWVLIQATQGGN